MTKLDGIYKCDVCGNIVSLIELGGGTLVCCGQDMKLFEEKSEDEGNEKHVPVIETTDTGLVVKVGSNPHPMEDSHYIQLVQLLRNGKVFVSKKLKPSDQPIVSFCLENKEGVTARALCNLHGLWKS